MVYSSVSYNEERLISICINNDLKIWRSNVDYRVGEDAKMLIELT